jgi:parallel beta-helix repeat protein
MTTYTVSNLNNAGAGSLRAAIEAANAAGGPSTIAFSVRGVINLTSALPDVTAPVTIDGNSAPTHTAGGPPVVEVNFNHHAGLTFASGAEGSQLLGLAVCGAGGNGVTLQAGSVTLAGNYIGLDLDGRAAGNAGDGVYVAATSSNDQIGANPGAAVGVISNVISGNRANGIVLDGATNNTLVDNYIGTDPTGAHAIANGGNGILLTNGANSNEIGGTAFTDPSTGAENNPTGNKGTTTPVFVVPPLGNLVSGNNANGILIEDNSQNNVLNGNFVGTAAGGNAPLGNRLDGVDINNADNNALIGCTVSNQPFVYYNVLSGNGANGLEVTSSNNVTVLANFFGIGADNATLVGNGRDGILVNGSSQNTLVGGIIPLGNVEGGNGKNGIEVTGTAGGFTTFNSFGGLLAFGGAAPNRNDGLLITATGGNQTVEVNAFSGNGNNGIEIGGFASGVTVDPNVVGLDITGAVAMANGGDGLLIDGFAHDNTIGGYTTIANGSAPRNAFSGNDGYGIAILGHAYANQVFNSVVGTDVAGTAAVANLKGGILIGGEATANTIGGIEKSPSAPVANLISGNDGNGITLQANSRFSLILNNEIGYNASGQPVLLNSGRPIAVHESRFNLFYGNQIATSGGASPPAVCADPHGDTIGAVTGLTLARPSFVAETAAYRHGGLPSLEDYRFAVPGAGGAAWNGGEGVGAFGASSDWSLPDRLDWSTVQAGFGSGGGWNEPGFAGADGGQIAARLMSLHTH